MAFARQNINTTSTFTTGNEVVSVNNPTFSLWSNNTSSGTTWNLGNLWTVDSSSTKLDFKYNNNTAISFNQNGIDKLVLGSQSEPSNPSDGTIANINGVLKVYI